MPLYEETLVPRCRGNQVFIDHATIPVPAARRIAAALEAKGAQYVAAAISGGQGGAESGRLRMFVGGDKGLVDDCRPLFEAAGNPEKLVYCGSVGMAQTAKVVQQLTGRLPDLARLEVVQFGLKSGLSLDLIRKALGITADSNDPYARLCDAVESGEISEKSYEFSEWEFYLDQAEKVDFTMPIIETLFKLVRNGELKAIDGAGRSEPSVWDELMEITRPD